MGLFDWWFEQIDLDVENNVRRGFFSDIGWPFRESEGSRRARTINIEYRQFKTISYLKKHSEGAIVEDI